MLNPLVTKHLNILRYHFVVVKLNFATPNSSLIFISKIENFQNSPITYKFCTLLKRKFNTDIDEYGMFNDLQDKKSSFQILFRC